MYKGVEFYEEGNSISNLKQRRDTRSFLVKTVMNLGFAKTETQANYVLIGIAGVFLLVSIILMSKAFSSPSEPPKGFKGDIPDLPEYQNPPMPENF